MMVHLWLCQMMYRMDFNGFKNHIKEESGRLQNKEIVKLLMEEQYESYIGFSRPFGSSRPSPAGFFSASSAVRRINSASTLPCRIKICE